MLQWHTESLFLVKQMFVKAYIRVLLCIFSTAVATLEHEITEKSVMYNNVLVGNKDLNVWHIKMK